MSSAAMSPRWKTLLCGAGMAAVLLAGCRKSENPAPQARSEATRHPPFGYIESPKENEVVTSGSRGYGWALDDSGITIITVSLDGAPAAPAEIDQSSPAVKEAYPTFPRSDKAGFVFEIPPIASGPHLLVVSIEGKDGGRTDLKRHVQVK
jgi:hypothetical protein